MLPNEGPAHPTPVAGCLTMRRCWQATRVRINDAMAGPTPPGTGVIQLHLGATWSKSTSPVSRCPERLLASGMRLMPTSITTAPSLTMSSVTKCARPMAATRMSARRGSASPWCGCGTRSLCNCLGCLPSKQQRHWGAHNGAPPQDDRVLPRGLDAVALQQAHDAHGGRRQKTSKSRTFFRR